MKILVVGGSSGLGQVITEHFGADQVSRSNGYTVPDDIDKILELSVNYNVVVNCLPDSNQNKLLSALFDHHDTKRLDTYFITIGSLSWHINESGHSKRDLFDWSEKQMMYSTTVRHTLVNPAYLWNSKNTGMFEPIPKEDMLNVIDFLIKQSYTSSSVIPLLDIKGLFKC